MHSEPLSSAVASGGGHRAHPERLLFPPHHRDRRDPVEGGHPSTTRVLYARYTSVRCARSTMRTTCVSLKRSDVRWLNTSAFFGSFARSTVIGPTCRHTMAKRERSSATPNVPFTPPVRAWERWHVTPGTFGSSKALTQILSFAPSIWNVVETQPMSSAWRPPTAPPSSTTTSIQTPLYPRIA